MSRSVVLSAVLPGNTESERQTFGCDDQRHDHLHAVGALVPAVAEPTGIGFVFGHVALEVSGSEIVKQHVKLRAEEIAPAPTQMRKECVLVCEQTIQAAIERVVLRVACVHSKQIGQGRRAEPVPVQPPFAAGREQAVKREHSQHFLPVRAFAAHTQTRGERKVSS